MIPLPPRDAALPGLATALDGDAMRELLAPLVVDGSLLNACRPTYVRYKPGTNCLVLYRLELDSGPTLAQVKLYAGARAEKKWSRGSIQLLAEDVTTPLAPVAHLPSLGAVLTVFPVDEALPALAFAGRTSNLVRYKPGRKALFRYVVGDHALYTKLFADDRGSLVLRAERELAAAGIELAKPLWYEPGLRMLVHAEAAGNPLTAEDTVGQGAAGEALARLHAAECRGLRLHTWADEAGALIAAARTVAAVRPELAEATSRLAYELVDRLAALPPATATGHGDFYDDQVLVGADGAVLLDLDEVRAAHPLLDVGNFLGHLAVAESAGSAFLDGYGRAADGGVALFEAVALLKLAIAPFRRLEPDWPETVERRVRLAEARLATLAPASTNGRPFDAALPQLGALTQRAVVERTLERAVYHEAVVLREATVVRHKPGRRCTLRYDVQVGAAARPERLYAKTFASERGPRVYRTLRSLTGTVELPEPVAYVPELKLLLQREVQGRPARSALVAGDEALAVQIADAVHELHRSGVALERFHRLEDELDMLRARVAALGRSRKRAAACLAAIEREAACGFAWRARPVHRDLYHDQVLVHDGGVAFLDLDDAALSEPAVDVANLLAHLRLLALEEPADRERIAACAAAFRARCAELDPDLDEELVELLEAATLLRLACIHEEHALRLLRECERLLSVARVARLGDGPPLALDGNAVLGLVSAAVEARAGARPTSCRLRLLRSKKGRAVVVYELETAAGMHTLVGKWFGDDEAESVPEILSVLRDHGFAGSDFAVPEPVLYAPELRVLFTDLAAGPALRERLEDDQHAARRAGAWLARFHSCGAQLPRAREPAEYVDTVIRWASREGELTSAATALAVVLESVSSPQLPTHGDFASADVLVPPGGPTVVVDFDQAAMGDPALDVLNFEATLTLRGLRRYRTPNAFATARRAFREGYEEYAPLPPLAHELEALVWLRLAFRNLVSRRANGVWRYALERARVSSERTNGA